eukprot:Skav226769  [mRNA]  locus=scaffold8:173589:177173:- [translate_table: standard]
MAVPASPGAMADDLSHVSFANPDFLEKNGLTSNNVLEYFYTSPFYQHLGPNSLNEQRRRGLQAEAQPGSHEFVVLAANEDAKEGRVETCIFVIQRLQHPATPKETYYVVAGTVYQAPELSELFKSALCQSAVGALGILKKQLEAMRPPEVDQPNSASPGWPAWCVFEQRPVPSAWRTSIEGSRARLEGRLLRRLSRLRSAARAARTCVTCVASHASHRSRPAAAPDPTFVANLVASLGAQLTSALGKPFADWIFDGDTAAYSREFPPPQETSN